MKRLFQHPASVRRATVSLSIICGVILGSASVALAGRPGDLSTKWPVNDDNPGNDIPSVEARNRDPLEFSYFLQDLVARAQPAYEKGNWEEAVKYYEALARAVPDVATSFSHLCVAYSKLEKQDIALTNCAMAITLPGAKVFDHLRFLDLTLRKADLTSADIANVNASLDHLRNHAEAHPQKQPSEIKKQELKGREPEKATEANPAKTPEQIKSDLEALRDSALLKAMTGDKTGAAKQEETLTIHLPTEIELRSCKLAARVGDDDRLAECIAALQSYKVNEKLLLPFMWARALSRKDEALANKLMADAVNLKLPESVLASMQAEQNNIFFDPTKYLRWSGLGLVFAIVLLIGSMVLRKKLRAARTPHEAQA